MATDRPGYLLLAGICFCLSCSTHQGEHNNEPGKKMDSITLTNEQAAQDTGFYYDFNALKGTLPAKIDNYIALDTAGGETLSKETSGGRQSYARQEYTNAERSIAVSIVDYSYAKQTMKDLLGMYRRNASVQMPEVEFKQESTGDSTTKVFSRFTKSDGYNSIIASYNDNIIITVDGNDKTTIRYLKKIAADIFNKLPR